MTITAKLHPARPDQIKREHLPFIPEWWPLDPAPSVDRATGELVMPNRGPYSEQERTQLRLRRAQREARSGPFDGQRLIVDAPENGERPETFVPSGFPRVRYVLDRQASTATHLVYRYDPSCEMHRELMAAVEAGFSEAVAGQGYALDAREEDRS